MNDIYQPIRTGSDWFVPKPLLEKSIESQVVLLIVMSLLALLTLMWVISIARREKRAYPLYIWAGGLVAIFYEPLGDLFAHVAYQEVNQLNLLSSFGFRVPLWVLPAYTMSVGAPVLWNMQRIKAGVTMRAWMGGYLACIVAAFLFEAPLIYLGYFEYYQPRPFSFLGYPIWMAFANAGGFMFVTPVVVHFLNKTIIGERYSFLYILLVPVIAAGAHAGASLAIGFALNATRDAVLINVAALVSMSVAIIQVWVAGKTVVVDSRADVRR